MDAYIRPCGIDPGFLYEEKQRTNHGVDGENLGSQSTRRDTKDKSLHNPIE